MRYRGRKVERERERKQWIEIYMERCRNKESRSGTGTKGSSHGFLADTSDCTGRISTTKHLIMLELYTPAVICTVSESVCYTSTKWLSLYGMLGMKEYNLRFRKCTSHKAENKYLCCTVLFNEHQRREMLSDVYLFMRSWNIEHWLPINISTIRLVLTDVKVKRIKELRHNTKFGIHKMWT